MEMALAMKQVLLLLWVAAAVFIALPISSGLSAGSAGKSPHGHHGSSRRKVLKLGKDAMDQQMADKIDRLPGQPYVSFEQYSGYVTVEPNAGRALFYWLIEAWTDAPDKPLVLWLNGGPGCSSIAYGAAEEIGPFLISPDSASLYLNQYAWNREANLLFLESPAGVGFSYTNRSSDLNTTGDARTASDAGQFLAKWFERFPQYQNRPFYIAGESYAGHYVPQLAQLVNQMNKKKSNPLVNLKGILMGNADLDNCGDSAGQIDYWYHHAMISDETYLGIKNHCKWNDSIYTENCNQLLYSAFYEIGNIDLYSLYTPKCLNVTKLFGAKHSRRFKMPKIPNQFKEESEFDPCSENYAEVYFNRPDVQRAMHANATRIKYQWTACSETLLTHWQDSPASVLWILKELIASGIRLWIYSGDADGVVPVQGTRYSINSLKLNIKKRWFPWYMKNQQVGGRSVEYEGLTFVTIRGAGHEVPLLHRGPSLALFHTFLSGQSLPRSNETMYF